jgi:hypothetical protein
MSGKLVPDKAVKSLLTASVTAEKNKDVSHENKLLSRMNTSLTLTTPPALTALEEAEYLRQDVQKVKSYV